MFDWGVDYGKRNGVTTDEARLNALDAALHGMDMTKAPTE